MLTLDCFINYTAPDGAVYVAGETYTVDEESCAQLLAGAPGHFVVESRPDHPLEAPPLDRQAKPRQVR